MFLRNSEHIVTVFPEEFSSISIHQIHPKDILILISFQVLQRTKLSHRHCSFCTQAEAPVGSFYC